MVEAAVQQTAVLDMHTHLFPPSFGDMNLWGMDALLTYHYLIAETFRTSDVSVDAFWAMPRDHQADLIWDTLFVRSTPLSEATRGVVTVLSALGLDPSAPNLSEARSFFAALAPEEYVDRVLSTAGVSGVVMTNDPLDDAERAFWESGASVDPRFHAALRLDPILNDWPSGSAKLRARGYNAAESLDESAINAVRHFLDDWITRLHPLYLAVSLPDEFRYPDGSLGGYARHRLIEDAVLPAAREHGLPFALMIGVRRAVNPALRLAGDGLGRADISAVERLCANHADNRFLVTVLSREDQHELCVAARKFRNLMPFGCWWFLNNPSIIAEITAERLEMLGTTFIPQHSDARVLDQLLYKWPHARRVLSDVLVEMYVRLAQSGRRVTPEEVQRDVTRLFSGNFADFAGGTP
jgi:hypothetical protein